MTLEPGQTLLHYRLDAQIGAGGMGVVWRATDTNLDREVAIKVLPSDFALDDERLARFDREARLLASLSHPNIAAVHGLHEAGGVRFLAMELVPGEDLAERLRRGPFPLDDALAVAAGVAAGLESAHASGVIHRDLKPANVQLTPAGDVKILDFGLAKALSADREGVSGSIDPSMSPTLTSAGTVAGVVLGTASYMSPEQARGRDVDRRADVWAFGCLLYELLTGERAFPGETAAEVIGAVLHKEPDLSRLPAATPPGIRRLLDRCLRKKPKQRLRDMGDAGLEIADSVKEPAEPDAALATRAPGSKLSWIVAAVASIVALVAIGTGWRSEATKPLVTRTSIVLPEDSSLLSEIAVFRDGRRLVYAAREPGGAQRLYLRSLDRFDAAPIEGTAGATDPFLSPDEAWIGFATGDEVLKVPVGGGAPIGITRRALRFGAVWLPDDTLILGGKIGGGLERIPVSGGEAQTLTRPDSDAGEITHGRPYLLPDGKTVLFTIGAGDSSHVGMLSLDTGEWERLIEGAAGARYLNTGHLVYSRAGVLFLITFDLSRLELTGTAVPIVEDVHRRNFGGLETARFAVSHGGTLVYAPREPIGARTLIRVDRSGAVQAIEPRLEGGFMHPRVSPDGRRVAVTGIDAQDQSGDVWLVDLERGSKSRLTTEGVNYTPVWSPDGARVAYVSNGNIAWTAVDGSGSPEVLLRRPEYERPTSFSPDGNLLAFVIGGDGGDIGVLSLDDRSVERLTTPFKEMAPTFSPDGGLLAYVSNDSGRDEVYVRRWPGSGGKWVVSTEGGRWPVWSRDGTELFYRAGDRFLAVDVELGAEPSFGKPRVVFEGGYLAQTVVANFDVFPDGEAFVTVEFDDPAPREIRVVQRWFDELR